MTCKVARHRVPFSSGFIRKRRCHTNKCNLINGAAVSANGYIENNVNEMYTENGIEKLIRIPANTKETRQILIIQAILLLFKSLGSVIYIFNTNTFILQG